MNKRGKEPPRVANNRLAAGAPDPSELEDADVPPVPVDSLRPGDSLGAGALLGASSGAPPTVPVASFAASPTNRLAQVGTSSGYRAKAHCAISTPADCRLGESSSRNDAMVTSRLDRLMRSAESLTRTATAMPMIPSTTATRRFA